MQIDETASELLNLGIKRAIHAATETLRKRVSELERQIIDTSAMNKNMVEAYNQLKAELELTKTKLSRPKATGMGMNVPAREGIQQRAPKRTVIPADVET